MEYLKTHIFYVVIAIVALVAFRSWLEEHDARLMADQQVKASEARVRTLEEDLKTIQKLADRKVEVIVKERDAIKTPAQAIPIVDAFDPQLKPRPTPGFDTAVTVEAVALARDLENCRIDRVKLEACEQTTKLKDQQLAEKDHTIAALKKPKSFWKRTISTLKVIGISAAAGAILGGAL